MKVNAGGGGDPSVNFFRRNRGREGGCTASALARIRFCLAAWFLSRAAALSFSTLLHSSISSSSTSAVDCWAPSGRLLSVYTLHSDVLRGIAAGHTTVGQKVAVECLAVRVRTAR